MWRDMRAKMYSVPRDAVYVYGEAYRGAMNVYCNDAGYASRDADAVYSAPGEVG